MTAPRDGTAPPVPVDEGFLPLLRAKASAAGERLFAHVNGSPLTFRTLDQMSDAIARGVTDLGIEPGDRVAVMMHTHPATVAVVFGLAKAGCVWVPINVRLLGENLRYILEHSEPRLVIADAELTATIRDCGAAIPASMIRGFGGAGAANGLQHLLTGHERFGGPAVTGKTPLAISYTSGTTGRPKGVVVTHQMLRFAGEAAALASGVRDGNVLFVWEPLYHIGGSQLVVLPLIRNVSLAMVQRFSASRFWQQARDAGASHMHYLGGILQILLRQPPSPLDRSHGVQVAWGGGCPPDVWGRFADRFGVEIRECYGMTEASSITTFNDAGAIGAVGRPVPWLSVDIRDEHNRPAGAGERGEIVVRERQRGAIFPGYFRNPEATAKALRDGELHTGDLGSLDEDGNLTFHGRLSDSIRCQGENVSAWEVEHVAAAHPAVEDCAVIGVRADIGEQDIKLFVKRKTGRDVDAAAVSDWLASRLASYQRPRYIAFVENFERTPSQRIMKHKLSQSTADCWDRLAAGR
jgi:carnitine-CoA ligase